MHLLLQSNQSLIELSQRCVHDRLTVCSAHCWKRGLMKLRTTIMSNPPTVTDFKKYKCIQNVITYDVCWVSPLQWIGSVYNMVHCLLMHHLSTYVVSLWYRKLPLFSSVMWLWLQTQCPGSLFKWTSPSAKYIAWPGWSGHGLIFREIAPPPFLLSI